jgi:hypothetical protein
MQARASSSALPTTSGQGRHRLPVGSAKTWLQQQYVETSEEPPQQQYPLVVDPFIGNVRLTKVLMDGAAASRSSTSRPSGSYRLIYPRSGPVRRLFTGSSPGNVSNPSDNSICPSCFGTPSNFRRETLTFEVVGFRGTYYAVLGRPCYAKLRAPRGGVNR